jgi:glycosyltransferase involved in cell wall biosynthesis
MNASGKAPRILVVTPTLGDSRFLDETVASVAAQSADILHVMAVPAPKVAELQARFPAVRVCRDAGREGGIYGALNAGLETARGDWDWFTYINDDDALRPGFSAMLAREIAALEVADVAYGDVELVDESGRHISRITIERNPAWIPALLQQGISPLMQQGMLFRRSVVERLGRFDTRYRLCADLDFWLRAYASGARFRAHRLRVAQFRLRAGQLSGDTAATEREQTTIVARHLSQPLSPFRQQLARWRYRWCNLPRYVARMRTRGFRSSYEVLQTEGARE